MLQATVQVSLTKDHSVSRDNVTPIEALLLVAEHHKNFGGCPVEVIGKITKTGKPVTKQVTKKVAKEVTGKGKDGKDITITVEEQVTEDVTTIEEDNRTDDQEIDRLRGRYSGKKIDAILSKIRNLPTTFEDALSRGTKIELPNTGMIAGSISETKL